ncbi:MAG: ABC transporter ATP-binding protein [Zetaproteobacteria bacterium]|nr:ABC transporter ATP-binding protein [Zetaproteobacteria bacterium]
MKAAQAPEFSSSQKMLSTELKPFWAAITTAITCTLILGVVSALVASMVAPCLTLMSATDGQTYTIEKLFGGRIATTWALLNTRQEFAKEQYLHILPMLLLAASLLKTLTSTAQNFLWENTAERVSLHLRRKLTSSFTHIHPFCHTLGRALSVEENLSSVCANDVRALRDYIVHFYGGLPRIACECFCLCIFLLVLSPKLFCVFLLGVLPLTGVIQNVGRKLRQRSKRVLDNYANLSEWIQQRLLGLETIKHYRQESNEVRVFSTVATHYLHQQQAAVRTKAKVSPLMESATFLALTAALIFAFMEMSSARLDRTVALSFFASLAFLAQSAGNIGRYLAIQKETRPALDRIYQTYIELLTLQQPPPGYPVDNFSIDLESKYSCMITDLSLAYPGHPPFVTRLDAQFIPGEMVALTGPSGTGKTSLALALLGQLPQHSGSICFNFDPKQHTLGYIPQKPLLHAASIAELISYPHTQANRTQVTHCLREVALDGWVQRLPNGMDTPFTGTADQASGGQKQRILLARALYHRSPFILVDEGTSALDPFNETLVLTALQKLAKHGSTVLLIAHRQRSIQACNRRLDL